MNTIMIASQNCEQRDNTALVKLLLGCHSGLSATLAAIDLVERDFLGAPVLPASIRELVAAEQRTTKQLHDLAGGREADLMDSTAYPAEAQRLLRAAARSARSTQQYAGEGPEVQFVQAMGSGLAYQAMCALVVSHQQNCKQTIQLLRIGSDAHSGPSAKGPNRKRKTGRRDRANESLMTDV